MPVSLNRVEYRRPEPRQPFQALCQNCDNRLSEIEEAKANEWGRILREKWTRERRLGV
jgi:hypothetical protein